MKAANVTESDAIILAGHQQTVDTIEGLHNEILAFYRNDSRSLCLDISQVQRADLTFFQLVLSCQKSFKKSSRRFYLRGLSPDSPAGVTCGQLGIELNDCSGEGGPP